MPWFREIEQPQKCTYRLTVLSELAGSQAFHSAGETSRLAYHIPNPTKETLSPLKVTPLPPLLGTTNPLPVAVDLPVLDVSCRWTHTSV